MIVLLVQQLHLVQPVKMGEWEIYNILLLGHRDVFIYTYKHTLHIGLGMAQLKEA